MTEPTLVLRFEGVQVELDAEQAAELAEAIAGYLGTIMDMRNGSFVEVGETQNLNWN